MLILEKLSKRFGATTAVADVSLEVIAGEFLTLLGPSGCGKTTTLRMIAGFETPTAGRVRLDGRDVTNVAPQRRGVGMVFQNYALFPHLNVFENVAFGLKARRDARRDIAGRVARSLELVDLAGFERRRVQELSGGQQQRVAVARALAPEPPILLLDEPLSNLDAALRERTRAELRALLKQLGITAVFVTHDQEEAFALSDRVALLEGGRLQQVGSPESLYGSPANAFVASFLGRANFLDAEIVGADGAGVLCALPNGARWTAKLADDATGLKLGAGDPVRLMIRPESLRLAARADPADVDLLGTIRERRFAGATTLYRVRLDAGAEVLVNGGPGDAETGDRVVLRPAETAVIHAFRATVGMPSAGPSATAVAAVAQG